MPQRNEVCINCWEWYPEDHSYVVTLAESNTKNYFCSLKCLVEWAEDLLKKGKL